MKLDARDPLFKVVGYVLCIVPSFFAFGGVYARLLNLASNLESQFEVGAYPLAMLLFLLLWLFIFNYDFLWFEIVHSRSVAEERLQAVPFASLLACSFILFAVNSYLGNVYVDMLVLLFYWVAFAFLFSDLAGRHLTAYLVIYSVTGSLQYVLSAFFDFQISLAWTRFLAFALSPVFGGVSYFVMWPDDTPMVMLYAVRERPLWIVAGCTGLPAVSVFLMLAGLIAYDLKVPLKRLFTSVVGGVLAILALNAFRLAFLLFVTLVVDEPGFWGSAVRDFAGTVNQAYLALGIGGYDLSSWVGYVELYHSFLGYALFSTFYVVYAWLMTRRK